MGNYSKYGNVMIDLETLSTRTNASIIEIGAVEFNKQTGGIGDTIDLIINPSEWGKNGRDIDGETIKWWFKQDESARKRFIDNKERVDLKKALYELSNFIISCDNIHDEKENVVVWGNGSTMDITILQSAYEYFDIDVPWKYWAVNDVRTIVDLNPKIKKETIFITDNGIKHSSIGDCLYQIKYLTNTLKSIQYGENLN